MKQKILKWGFLIFGSFLALDGFVLALCTNFNVGTILTIFLGIFLFVCGVNLEKIRTWQNRKLRILRTITITGLYAAVIFTVFLFSYGIHDTVRYNEDVLMVLGAGVNGETPTQPLVARLDKAVEYFSENPHVTIMVTGGQGPQEDITEAEAMTRYLVSKGIPPEKILREDRSTSTGENFKFSKKLLDEKFSHYTTAVITNDFHIYRAEQLAKITGLREVTTLHAPTPWYSAPVMYIREWLAIIKLWVFRR